MQKEPVFLDLTGAAKEVSVSDIRLSRLIDYLGEYRLELREDYFSAIVRSIVGQQLSISAARTIWGRVINTCGEITPENIIGAREDTLRGAGISAAKARYIRQLANGVIDGDICFEKIVNLGDTEVLETLTQIAGVGKWTAEMFLIFSLGRPDVLSTDDVGLRRAIKWLYGLENQPSGREVDLIGESWRPFRSIASLYLWEAVNRGFTLKPVELIIGNL